MTRAGLSGIAASASDGSVPFAGLSGVAMLAAAEAPSLNEEQEHTWAWAVNA